MKLPRSIYVSASLGIAYGLSLRLLLAAESLLSDGLVSISFFVVVPLAIGFIVAFLGSAEGRSGWKYAFFAPWIAIAGFLLATMLLLLEGSVCVVLALPGFLILSSVGGLLALLFRRWRVPATGTLCSIAMLPLILSPLEKSLPPVPAIDTVVTELTIDAPSSVVWSQITDVGLIQASELSWGLTRLLGVPQPLEAHMERASSGWVRHTRWARGVSFREIILESHDQQSLRWSFDFPPSAVPNGVLDEHVEVGGRYFGLIDGGYSLEPTRDGGTRLTLRTTYRVTARPSLYARYWAYLIMGDFHRMILDLIRDRSERAAARR